VIDYWSEKIVLTKEEILTELKKMGINTPSELRSFEDEYKQYALHHDPSKFTTKNYRLKRKLLLKERHDKDWISRK
jgi:hypothetical protein